MKKLAAVLVAVLALATIGHALFIVGNGVPKTTSGTSVSSTGLTANTNYIIDVNSNMGVFPSAGDVISAQLNVASATFPTATFKDGAQAAGRIAVGSTASLNGIAGTDTLNVAVSSALPGNSFNVNGVVFTEGQQWTADLVYSSKTAISIASAINLGKFTTGVSASTTTAKLVTLTCTTFGAICNTFTLTTSSPTALIAGAAKFSGGQDAAAITIGPFIIQQGATQGAYTWAVGANTNATAINISSAIMNTPAIAAVLKSTTVGNGTIVYTTSVANGSTYNYAISVTTAALTATSMTGGIDPAYALSGTSINLPATTFTTGLQVAYSTASGTGITGLAYGTTYYIGVIDASHVGLATTLGNAQAGTFVTLASSQTGTSANNFLLTPATITGVPSFIWQSSDDGVTFANITSNFYGVAVASASLVSPYTATSFTWDFGRYRHRYLNLKATAPTAGAAAFTLYLNVKSDTR